MLSTNLLHLYYSATFKYKLMNIKIRPLRHYLLILSLLLVTTLLLVIKFSSITRPSTSTKSPPRPLSPTPSPDQVLGSYDRRPEIFVSKDNGWHSRTGIIPLSSTDDPTVQIGSYDLSGQAQIDIYQANRDLLLQYLLHDSEGQQLNPTINSADLPHIATTHEQINHGYDNATQVTLPIEESGIWYITIQLDNTTQQAFVIRSQIATLVKEGDNQFIFWAQNFESRRSLTQGNITIYNLQDQVTQIASTHINNQGIAASSITPQADIALTQLNSDIALTPLNLNRLNSYRYEQYQPKTRQARFFTFTDRPLYKPGDTIYFKSIIRDDDDARYTIPIGTAQVAIRRGYQSQPLFEKSYSLSSQGTISGQFSLPPDSSAGHYQLQVNLDPQSSNYYLQNTHYFQVEHFRKPEYSIDIATPHQEFISGDNTFFTINGNYFFGQPLADQTIKYQIHSSDFYEYHYISSTPLTLSDDYRYGYRHGKKLKEGTATLNQQGQVQVDLDLKLTQDLHKSQVLSIEAEFDDGSGNPSFARKNIIVYSGEFGIFRTNLSSHAQVNQPTTLDLQLTPRRSSPVSQIPLTAKVKRTSWIKYQEPDKKYPSYKKEEEGLPDLSTTSDSQGNATFQFTPPKPGSYTFTVQGKDSRDNLITKDFRIWASSKDQPYYSSKNQNNLTIQPDQEQYQHTDSAKLTIHSEIPDRDIFLSLDRARLNRYQIVHLTGYTTTIDLPLVVTDIPNISATISSFSSSFLDTASTSLIVSSDPKKLLITLTPDQQQYNPGETATVNIQTTDLKGNPVSTNTAIWAVDKAIFELTSSNLRSVHNAFWRQRYDYTAQSHSLQGIYINTAEGGGCFAPDTPILMANRKTKPIKDIKVGDQILTRTHLQNPQLTPAKVTNVHSQLVSGFLIINHHLKVTPNHRLWVNNNWRLASQIQIGDTLLNSHNQPITVSSLQWQADNLTVYNFTVEKYHTYFAGNLWVHNQKGNGSTGRSVFKDTAYWNPSVQTDSQGRAQVQFSLPDNLTTWVITSIGSTNQTQVGQTSQDIVVTKDVVVRPILPNIIRGTDTISLSALVQNFSTSPHPFTVKLQSPDLNIPTTTQGPISISPQDTQQFFWKATPKQENSQAKLTFSATTTDSSNLEDTVTQEIPIPAFGFWEKHGQTGEGTTSFSALLSPDTHLEKSQITLSLSSTLFGTLPTAMTYLANYPYGCVEQTTSRFVPAVIAKQNPHLFPETIAQKDIEDIIQEGATRLAKLQKSDGGWTWWYQGRSDPFITAYVVEYLLAAKISGINLNQSLIDRAQHFLENDTYYDYQDRASKSYSNQENIARKYALTLLDPEKSQNISITLTDLSPQLLSLAIITNIKLGDTEPSTNGLAQLISQAKYQGNAAHWESGSSTRFGSRDTSTAFAIRALVASGKTSDLDLATQASRYLLRNRQSDFWSNSFATAQVVQAAVDLINAQDEFAPNYKYTVQLDGQPISQGTVTNPQQLIPDLSIPTSNIQTTGSTLTITQLPGQGQLYSALLINEFHTDQNAPAQDNGFSVTRQYTSDKGPDYSLAVGDTVTVQLTVSGLDAQEHYGVIQDHLPAGIIPINPTFKSEQYGSSPTPYTYGVSGREITPDGIILSLYRVNSGTQTYTYKARVVSQGNFLAPPATASLMYTPEIHGRSSVQTISIGQTPQLISTPTPSIPQHQKIKSQPPLLAITLSAVSAMLLLIFLLAKKRLFRKKPPSKSPPDDDSDHLPPTSIPLPESHPRPESHPPTTTPYG
jgi:uncharacterized protein YfaS (alpha-2-macroglobulin family)